MPSLKNLQIPFPIIQAPMAGGATTPELIAAVSNFGGIGSLGAGTSTPETINQKINEIKALTQKPFMVNLMVLTEEQSSTFDCDIPDWLAEYYKSNDIDVTLPKHPAQNFTEQLQVLYDNPVPIVSFTFGIVSRDQIERLQQLGTVVIGTANHPKEAQAWEQVGADAVCVQGVEAGGHRGGWLAESDADPLGLLTLISQTKNCTSLPLIAAGGIMTSKDIKAIQAAGADFAQLGTAFLATDKSGVSLDYKNALVAASQGKRRCETRLTRLFSGKLARGLVNGFLEDFAKFDNQSGNSAELPPYPQLNAMTTPMRSHAAKHHDVEHLSIWAGQGVSQVKKEPTTELLKRLVQDL